MWTVTLCTKTITCRQIVLYENWWSPVETKTTNTSLDGPVNRVHPGARIHLLPTVFRDIRNTTYWILYISQWPDEAHKMLCQQFMLPPERHFYLHSAVTHWLARRLQVPQESLEARRENTIRLGKHLTSDPLQWFTDWQMSCNITRTDLKCDLWGEEHYHPAGFGLQLWALWNRNHMRGVFCSMKTNTQRLSHN